MSDFDQMITRLVLSAHRDGETDQGFGASAETFEARAELEAQINELKEKADKYDELLKAMDRFAEEHPVFKPAPPDPLEMLRIVGAAVKVTR